MTVIVRERVSMQVERHLRNKIAQGSLPAGSRLIEEEIAAELNVSRTPVREALVLLQGKDMIRPVKSGGFEVRDFRRELLDMLDVRIALETHAVRKIAKRANDGLLRELKSLCAAMEALPRKAVEDRAKLNRKFHELLIGAAGNPRLVRIVNDYQEYFSAAQRLFDPKFIERTEREHREIVAALEAGDANKVARAVAEHIEGAGEFIMSHTEAVESPE
jgi:DNA-binding GntR family transcriptional regulator